MAKEQAAKFTPGPWRVSGNRVLVGDDIVCRVSVEAADFSPAKIAENARLIAAAPDLLEALQLIEQSFRDTDPDKIQDSDPDTAIALRKTRAALAKAGVR